MTLGPSFRHDDLEKAVRKVRTLAGVKFFGMPIGTIISPGMVREARMKHGDKKVDAMLVSQRRNTRRDARQAHFQNQALVRAKKREERVTANAAHRDRVQRDKEIRGLEATRKPAATAPPAAYVPANKITPSQQQASAKPLAQRLAREDAKRASTKPQATNTKMDRMIDLVHTTAKWTAKDIDDAISLVMEYRTVQNAEVRAMVQALTRRLQKEE